MAVNICSYYSIGFCLLNMTVNNSGDSIISELVLIAPAYVERNELLLIMVEIR